MPPFLWDSVNVNRFICFNLESKEMHQCFACVPAYCALPLRLQGCQHYDHRIVSWWSFDISTKLIAIKSYHWSLRTPFHQLLHLLIKHHLNHANIHQLSLHSIILPILYEERVRRWNTEPDHTCTWANGNMWNAENLQRVFCGIVMWNHSAKYPSQIFQIPHYGSFKSLV